MDTDPDLTPLAPAGKSGHGTESILAHLRGVLQDAPASEVHIATADANDGNLDDVIPAMLDLVLRSLDMDVVFVSEFKDGQRVFRYVRSSAADPVIRPGDADPLEMSWCKRIVDKRLPRFIPDAGVLRAQGMVEAAPFPIGTHLSVPVVLRNGSAVGTVCCFSFEVRPRAGEQDLALLQSIATFLAAALDRIQSLPVARGSEPDNSGG